MPEDLSNIASVKLKCIAIDDEPLALDLVEDFVRKVPYLEFSGRCDSAFEAIELITEIKPDILFLDINMPHLSGIEFIKTLDNLPMVIFTTAYPEHALEGFEVNAVDYLVKPFAFNRFVRATNKALELYQLKNSIPTEQLKDTISTENISDFLMIKVEYSTVKIRFSDIKYIEGVKDYLKIKTKEKSYLTKSTFKNILEKLPSDNFIRVHKSYIIAINQIESIERFRIKILEKLIPVGDHYKENFQKIIEKLSL